jgi:hypothetical protein
MGVRFECPAGHKLHVKAHLAGQRGICPECGLRFIVPNFSGGRVAEAPAGGGSSGSNRFVSVSLESSDSFAAGLDQAAAGIGPAADGGGVGWFVRPASGGQYGPIDAAGFQQWVSEGRVSGDSWVWRTGWSDWKSGREALQLFAAETAPLAPPLPSQRAAHSTPRSASSSNGAASHVRAATAPRPAAPAFELGDEETDDLLALPKNGSTQDFAATHVSPARAELLRRRKANQRLTLVLAGLTLVMVVAAIIVFATRGNEGQAETPSESAAPSTSSTVDGSTSDDTDEAGDDGDDSPPTADDAAGGDAAAP